MSGVFSGVGSCLYLLVLSEPDVDGHEDCGEDTHPTANMYELLNPPADCLVHWPEMRATISQSETSPFCMFHLKYKLNNFVSVT